MLLIIADTIDLLTISQFLDFDIDSNIISIIAFEIASTYIVRPPKIKSRKWKRKILGRCTLTRMQTYIVKT